MGVPQSLESRVRLIRPSGHNGYISPGKKKGFSSHHTRGSCCVAQDSFSSYRFFRILGGASFGIASLPGPTSYGANDDRCLGAGG